MNLPNWITLSRLIFGPVFILLYTEGQSLGLSPLVLTSLLTVVFTITFLTDLLDGYLARKYDVVTDFGKLVDPMTDSLVTISVLMTFTLEPISLPIPLVFIFIYRDMVVTTIRSLCALGGKAIAAGFTAKFKASMQNIVCYLLLALLFCHQLQWLAESNVQLIAKIAVSIVACFSLYSGFEYIFANWKQILPTTVGRNQN